MSDPNWSDATPWELMDHIVATHHNYLHRQLPLLAAELTEHTRRHWLVHPELLEARATFFEIWSALGSHLLREETTALPMLHARRDDPETSLAPFIGNIDGHVAEHAGAVQALAKLRSTLWDYRAPDDVSAGVQVTLDRLAELEDDLAVHIHLENDILFGQVRALG